MKAFRILAMMAAIATAAFTSCSVYEDDFETLGENLDGIVLRFDCGDTFDVKATTEKPGETNLNENLLSSVEVFMYPANGTGSDALLHAYFTNVQTSVNYSVSATDVIVAALCPNNADEFSIYAIANYPRIVAAVQSVEEDEDLTHTSVPELEAKLHSIEMTGTNVDTPQSKFIMATDGAITSGRVNIRNTTVVTTTVRLKRVAAKISILVSVASEYVFDNTVTIGDITETKHEHWEPQMEGMRVYLVNGSKTGQVSGLPIENKVPFSYQQLAFKLGQGDGEVHQYTKYTARVDNDGNKVYDQNGDLIFDPSTEDGTFYPSTYPFYTYPVKWNYGSDDEPYLKLVIPWIRQADPNQGISLLQKQYYYRVYCPGTPNPAGSAGEYDAEFIRNNWYKILLNVGILGSETDGGEVVLSGSYYIVDWQEREKPQTQEPGHEDEPTGVNDSDKEAEIKGARYLFVNNDSYELFNIDDLSFPYISSDECEIVDVYAKKYTYSGSQKDSTDTRTPAEWDIDIHLETTPTGGHVILNHPLNNDTHGSNYDTSPYIITFTLRQASNYNYAKNITVVQYPAIMIDLERNDVSSSPYSAFVNNGTVSGSSPSWSLGSSPGSNGTSSNFNYNMVIIQTTVLPSDSEYMLGDPRTSYVDNLNFSQTTTGSGWNQRTTYTDNWPDVTGVDRDAPETKWSVSYSSIQGTTRRLSYYLPVNPEKESDNIIAPKFRIASSRGATTPMTYANAFRRCASYQEYGYPAGRWRLPTVAEVLYIAKLNADGKIERLLGGETIKNGNTTYSETWQASKTTSYCYTEYWCNSGYMIVYDGKDSNWVTANGGKLPSPEQGTSSYSTSDTKYVRCVYDDWYWDEMTLNGTDVSQVTPKTTFKWGDMPR